MSSSLRSRSISDYFEAEFGLIRADEPVPFAMHLYFAGSDHILVWRAAGDFITREFLEKYRERKLKSIWIYRGDESAWKRYLAPKSSQALAQESPSASGEPAPATPGSPTSADAQRGASSTLHSRDSGGCSTEAPSPEIAAPATAPAS